MECEDCGSSDNVSVVDEVFQLCPDCEDEYWKGTHYSRDY